LPYKLYTPFWCIIASPNCSSTLEERKDDTKRHGERRFWPGVAQA
jgi:hypothetical protein